MDLLRQHPIAAILALWMAAGLAAWWIYRRWQQRELARARAWAEEDALEDNVERDLDEQNFLERWLYLAGYRSRGASAGFVALTLASVAIGLAIALAAQGSGLVGGAVAAAEGVPGGVGDLARPILFAGPWILLALWVTLPWSIVNARRKRRVAEIEQDLPVTLELLATMSESGLGFDAALTHVIESRNEKRPLAQELSTFQLEALGGVPRVQCFRRLARRVEVSSVSIFASALVQAEQVGAGFSSVLRIQADDVRNRRREQANSLAQALPVKLIFPLVLCFLPGIFVTTLGPTFLQFLKLTESMQGR
jgi:tight adherence protein C